MNDELSVVWMRCPYPDELCGAEGTWELTEVYHSGGEVTGEFVCVNGHRWRITKLRPVEVTP